MAFIIGNYAVVGIGKPDGTVRLDDYIIGRIEFLALVSLGNDIHPAVMFHAGYTSGTMFAGYQPSLKVSVMTIGKI